MIRGGQGFLFPDHNSISNVGQTSLDDGTSVEVMYGQTKLLGSTLHSLTPSLSYANGRMAIVVQGNRSGTGFNSDESTDTIGGGIGFSLGRRRTINLGVSYVTSLESGGGNVGQLEGAFNVNPSRGAGVSFGAAAGIATGDSANNAVAAKVGLGYAGRNRNNNIEANLTFADINETDAYTIGGYFTLGGDSYYFGGGFEQAKADGDSASNLLGRLGLIMGRGGSVDISAFVEYSLEDNVDPFFGASLRANF